MADALPLFRKSNLNFSVKKKKSILDYWLTPNEIFGKKEGGKKITNFKIQLCEHQAEAKICTQKKSDKTFSGLNQLTFWYCVNFGWSQQLWLRWWCIFLFQIETTKHVKVAAIDFFPNEQQLLRLMVISAFRAICFKKMLKQRWELNLKWFTVDWKYSVRPSVHPFCIPIYPVFLCGWMDINKRLDNKNMFLCLYVYLAAKVRKGRCSKKISHSRIRDTYCPELLTYCQNNTIS